MGGHKCKHQVANGAFLGRNLRHREAVSSNCYLPAMDRYLGFSVRLSISGPGESGHCGPYSYWTHMSHMHILNHLGEPPGAQGSDWSG